MATKSEAWWALVNALANLLKCPLGTKMLRPPGSPCLGKGGYLRCITRLIGSTGLSKDNHMRQLADEAWITERAKGGRSIANCICPVPFCILTHSAGW